MSFTNGFVSVAVDTNITNLAGNKISGKGVYFMTTRNWLLYNQPIAIPLTSGQYIIVNLKNSATFSRPS